MASSDHSYVSDDSNASFEKVNASECSFGSNKPNRKTSSTTTAISFSTSVSQDEKWIWSGEGMNRQLIPASMKNVFEAFDKSNSSLDDPFGDDDLETAIETVDDDGDLPTAIETPEDDDLLETAIETPSELDLSTNTAIATEEDLEHALEESLDDSFVTADDDKSSNGSDFSVISEFDEDELLCSTRSGSSLELVTALETSTATALETSTVLEASTALEESTATALDTSTDALEVSTATALEESTVTAVDLEDATALEDSTATAQLEESTATALEDSTATALDLDSSSDYSVVSSIDCALDTCQDESVVTALEESTATALEDSTATALEESTVQEETSAAQLEESTATALEDSIATALEESTRTALEDSTATALEESTLTALEESTATALEEGTITALEDSTATALEESTLTALEDSTATALEESTATALEDSTASSLDESTATALDDSALAALDESVFTDTPLDDSTTTAILTEEERRQQFVNHLHRDAPEMDETQSLNSSVTGSLSSDDSLSNMPDDLDDSDCCDEDCSCDEHSSCGCHEDCSCDEDCDEEEELEDEDVSDEESICGEDEEETDEEEEIEEEICQESVQEEEVPEQDEVQEVEQEAQQEQVCPEGSRPCNQTEQLFYNCGCDTLVKKERDIAIKSLEDEKQALVSRCSNVTLPEDGLYENYRLCLESMEYALRATPNHVGLLQVLKLITEIKTTVEKMESILNKAEQEESAKKENEVIEVAGKHKVYYAEPWMVSDIEDDSEDDVTDEEVDSEDDVTSEDSTSDDSSTEATDHTTSGEELSEYLSTGDDSQVSSDGSVAPSEDDNKEVRTYQCEFCDKYICADCGEIIDEEDKKETAVETPVMKSLSEDKTLSPVVLKAVLATYETLSKFKKIIIVTQKMHSDLNVAPIIKKYETIVEPNVEELKAIVKEEGMFFLTKLNYEINECMERLEAEAGPELWKMITDNVAITPESRLSDALLASSREERIRFYQELIEGDFNNFFQLPIGTIQNLIN